MSRRIYAGGTATTPGYVASGIKNPRNGARKRKNQLVRRMRAMNAKSRSAGHGK